MKLARTAVAVVAAAAAVAATASVAMAAHSAHATHYARAERSAAPVAPPVVKIKTSNLGVVVATRKKLGLYTWDQEKDFKVHCTGACLKQWPPVLLMKGEKVKAMVHGIMGEFGTITRPDGATQLTWDKHPVYTFSGDTANVVKCDNVDGWHAVRAA